MNFLSINIRLIFAALKQLMKIVKNRFWFKSINQLMVSSVTVFFSSQWKKYNRFSDYDTLCHILSHFTVRASTKQAKIIHFTASSVLTEIPGLCLLSLHFSQFDEVCCVVAGLLQGPVCPASTADINAYLPLC